MNFTDKYTTFALAEKDKIAISNETYALGEMLQELKNMLERLSVK